MSSSKLRKISRIVKEISIQNSQSRYDISGLDLSLCKFYYRTSQALFKDLPSGDYTIDTSSNQQSLVVQNSAVISSGEAIQVCYEMDLSSSKYEVDFEVDINRLTTSYNELVDDVHTLWEYIRKTGMIADDTTMDLILPQLNINEVWVKSEDGYKGMPLDDVEQSIKDIIDKYSQQKIEEIKKETTAHVNKEIERIKQEAQKAENNAISNIKEQEKTSTQNIINEGNKQVQNVTNTGNNKINEITQHTESKKTELNNFNENEKQELVDLKNELASQLEDLIEGAVADKGLLPNGTDWHTLSRGSYYVTDLFNSDYKNHPVNIANIGESKGIVIVGIAENGASKVIRYYSTSKRMFFTILVKTNIWSEWAVMGGGQGTSYEITQPNHGFIFNAITLDGNTNQWVLADNKIGADAVAIKKNVNSFYLIMSGLGTIPSIAKDDRGNSFVNDEYYFMSLTKNGAFQREKPTYGIFQPLFHTRMLDGKLIADVQIGEVHDLTSKVVDSNTAEELGLVLSKDFDPFKYHSKFAFDTLINHFNKLEVEQNIENYITVLHEINKGNVELKKINGNTHLKFTMSDTCCDKENAIKEPKTIIVLYDRKSNPQLSQVILKEQKENQTGVIEVYGLWSQISPILSRKHIDNSIKQTPSYVLHMFKNSSPELNR